MRSRPLFAACMALGLSLGCSAIRLEDIETPRPVPEGSCLVVGFLGGRDRWDDVTKGVRRVALRLCSGEPAMFSETFENRRRDVAEAFVVGALDRDGDDAVSGAESSDAKLVLYGQSFGGAAVVKFARQLEKLRLPIRLTVQIDSVGRADDEIPPNVRYAANLYQNNGWLISGEHPIRAADPRRTTILGNWRFDYNRPPGSEVSIDHLPWWKTMFRVAHARMDRDERVWKVVELLIRAACRGDELDKAVWSLPLPDHILRKEAESIRSRPAVQDVTTVPDGCTLRPSVERIPYTHRGSRSQQ